MTAGNTSFPAWLRARYAPATVATTLTDLHTLESHAHAKTEPPARLRVTATRWRAWFNTATLAQRMSATGSTPEGWFPMLEKLCAPKARKTRKARERAKEETLAPVGLIVHRQWREAIVRAVNVLGQGGAPWARLCTLHAIRAIAEDGWSVARVLLASGSDVLPYPPSVAASLASEAPRPIGKLIAPRTKVLFTGANAAYQRIRRTWPEVLTLARRFDETIPVTLAVGDLVKR